MGSGCCECDIIGSRGASNVTLYTSGWCKAAYALRGLRYHRVSVDSARSQRPTTRAPVAEALSESVSQLEGTRPERAAFNVMFRAAQCVRESRRDAVTKQRRVKTDCKRIKDATASNVL